MEQKQIEWPVPDSEREFIKQVVKFHESDSRWIRKDEYGDFNVDPETFFVVIPGKATREEAEDTDNCYRYIKEWAGATFVCKWFDMDD